MHRNEIFYALICINNLVLSCLISMLSRFPPPQSKSTSDTRISLVLITAVLFLAVPAFPFAQTRAIAVSHDRVVHVHLVPSREAPCPHLIGIMICLGHTLARGCIGPATYTPHLTGLPHPARILNAPAHGPSRPKTGSGSPACRSLCFGCALAPSDRLRSRGPLRPAFVCSLLVSTTPRAPLEPPACLCALSAHLAPSDTQPSCRGLHHDVDSAYPCQQPVLRTNGLHHHDRPGSHPVGLAHIPFSLLEVIYRFQYFPHLSPPPLESRPQSNPLG